MGRMLRAPLAMIPRRSVLRVLQGPLRGMKWVAGASNHGCWLGSYEQTVSRRLWSMLAPGCLFYDVGANAGYYTLMAARAGCRVVSFEPDPGNLEFLRRHVELNQLHDVTIEACAVSDRDGTASFERAGSMSKLGGRADVTVKTVRLDDYPPPDVMKMDIEGAEVDALRGFEKGLRAARPKMLIATHGADKQQQVVELLRATGYAVELLEDVVIAERSAQ